MSQRPTLPEVKAFLDAKIRTGGDRSGHELACLREALRILEVLTGLTRNLRASPVLGLVAKTLASGMDQPDLATRYRLGVHDTTPEQVLELLVADIREAMKGTG